MAFATTTLSSAVVEGDKQIVVASAASIAAGRLIKVNDEMMEVTKGWVSGTTIPVLRGQNGSVAKAHAVTTLVTHGLASDWASLGAQTSTQYPLAGKARLVVSYGAAGAIAHPAPGTDVVAVINGTAALAMTLAVPTEDLNGSILWIIGDGKAAHTVTAASGFGLAGSSYDVATFDTGGTNAICVMAMHAGWVLLSPMTGTLTAAVPAIA